MQKLFIIALAFLCVTPVFADTVKTTEILFEQPELSAFYEFKGRYTEIDDEDENYDYGVMRIIELEHSSLNDGNIVKITAHYPSEQRFSPANQIIVEFYEMRQAPQTGHIHQDFNGKFSFSLVAKSYLGSKANQSDDDEDNTLIPPTYEMRLAYHSTFFDKNGKRHDQGDLSSNYPLAALLLNIEMTLKHCHSKLEYSNDELQKIELGLLFQTALKALMLAAKQPEKLAVFNKPTATSHTSGSGVKDEPRISSGSVECEEN